MTKFLGNLINFEESTIRPTSGFQDSTASGVFNLHEQLMLNKQSIWPTAGVDDPTKFVENLFSVDTYAGNSGTQTITTGIDTSGEGGLVWIKSRSDANHHQLYDTVRGAGKPLYSSLTNSEGTNTNFASFTSTGFTLGYTSANGGVNGDSSDEYVAWTFRKAPKFFDVVTYTGDNSSSARDIAHSLGQAPGMIMIKRYNDSGYGWPVWHRSLSNGYWTYLNTTDVQQNAGGVPIFANNDQQTSTHFQLPATNGNVGFFNASGQSYVAYLFGHDTSSDGMIQCGSYTGDGGTSNSVNLGFEPQWVMIKASTSISGTANWVILDNIRGIVSNGDDERLYANTSGAEVSAGGITLTPNGFYVESNNEYNYSGATYIYMAIRRGPMQTPTSRSSVFDIDTQGQTGDGKAPAFRFGSYVDLQIKKAVTSTGSISLSTRLIGSKYFDTDTSDALKTNTGIKWYYNNGVETDTTSNSNNYSWMWKRAPKFFDAVYYEGNGSNRTITHNLGVVPEMMWIKNASSAEDWAVYYGDATDYLRLNYGFATADDNTYWNDTAPTSTVFTVGTNDRVNHNAENHLALLFATLSGISKIGTFSHTNGSSTDVDCGFSSGSKFVLVKRTDSTGSWYLWDSSRGIVSGNDPYILLDSNATQVSNTDYIDPLNSGFQIASGFTTGSYMFYAIAS